MSVLDDFDPNLRPTLNAWATYIPSRTTKGAFATHRSIGHAKNALKGSIGILYEWQNGLWVELFRWDETDERNRHCTYCGLPKGADKDHQYLSREWVKGAAPIALADYAYTCARDRGRRR